jgi:hypothetical protein
MGPFRFPQFATGERRTDGRSDRAICWITNERLSSPASPLGPAHSHLAATGAAPPAGRRRADSPCHRIVEPRTRGGEQTGSCSPDGLSPCCPPMGCTQSSWSGRPTLRPSARFLTLQRLADRRSSCRFAPQRRRRALGTPSPEVSVLRRQRWRTSRRLTLPLSVRRRRPHRSRRCAPRPCCPPLSVGHGGSRSPPITPGVCPGSRACLRQPGGRWSDRHAETDRGKGGGAMEA